MAQQRYKRALASGNVAKADIERRRIVDLKLRDPKQHMRTMRFCRALNLPTAVFHQRQNNSRVITIRVTEDDIRRGGRKSERAFSVALQKLSDQEKAALRNVPVSAEIQQFLDSDIFTPREFRIEIPTHVLKGL